MKNIFRTLPVLLLLFVAVPYAHAGLSESCYPAVQCNAGQDYYGTSCQSHIESLNMTTPSCQSVNGAPGAGKQWAFSCTNGCYQSTIPVANPCPGGLIIGGQCLSLLQVVKDHVPVTGEIAYKIWDGTTLTEAVHVNTAGCADGQAPISDTASPTGWSCGSAGVWSTDGTNAWRPTGNVGIGTATPGAGLHIKGANFPNSFVYMDTTADGQDAGMRLMENGNTRWHIFNGNVNDTFEIRNTAYSAVITGTQSGNVGIGTATPGYKLEVVGSTNLGGGTNNGLSITAAGDLSNAKSMVTDQATCTSVGGYYTVGTCYYPVKISGPLNVSGVGGIHNSYSNYGVLISDPDGLDVRNGIGNFASGSIPLQFTDDQGVQITNYAGTVGLSIAANGEISDPGGHVYVNDYLDVQGRLAVGHTSPGAGIHVKGTGWSDSFLFLDTNASGQDSGIRLMEAGMVKTHIYNQSSTDNLIIEREGGNSDIELAAYETKMLNNVDVYGNLSVNEEKGSNSWLDMYAGDGYSNYLDFSEMEGGTQKGFQLNNYGGSNRFYIRSYEHSNEINNATVRMAIERTTGDVGIGVADPVVRFHVYESASGEMARFQGPTGSVKMFGDGWLDITGNAQKPSGGSWLVLSDERLKDVKGEYEKGLAEIIALRPVEFTYKENNPMGYDSDAEHVGFVAQEVQPIFPESVGEYGSSGYLDFDEHPINVALVNAIKELKTENDALKAVICDIRPEAEICNQ